MSLQVLYEKRSVIIAGGTEELKKKYLVLGDLHIGFEEKFAQAGVRIQSNYKGLAEEIIDIAENHKVTDIILNGDLKSGTDRILQSEWEYVPKLLSLISAECHVTLVPGNHDGGISHLLPNSVELSDINGVFVEDNLILHGHTSPLSKYLGCSRIIMGHVHPIFHRRGNPLTGQPVWVFARVSRKAIFKEVFSNGNQLVELIVMPSFNKDLAMTGYASELRKEERRVSPLVREIREAEDAMIATLQGEIIGDSSMLSSLL